MEKNEKNKKNIDEKIFVRRFFVFIGVLVSLELVLSVVLLFGNLNIKNNQEKNIEDVRGQLMDLTNGKAIENDTIYVKDGNNTYEFSIKTLQYYLRRYNFIDED